jgi:hypothetical protein
LNFGFLSNAINFPRHAQATPAVQGTSALAYFSVEGGSEPGTLANNYNPLTQAGIAISNRRTAAPDTELAQSFRISASMDHAAVSIL